MLDDSESQHVAAVAATQKRVQGPQGPSPNLTISKPSDFTPTSDLELAKLAREQGKEVELNDDNQIVDKRELLSAGLNLSAPNTRKLGLQLLNGPSHATTSANVHTAVGTAASRREIQERRMREVRQQMIDEESRVARDKRDAEEEATRRVVAKRNNEDDVSSARERYLERKKKKLEEDEAAVVS
jgi:coiled-coil domain-containing protein 55